MRKSQNCAYTKYTYTFNSTFYKLSEVPSNFISYYYVNQASTESLIALNEIPRKTNTIFPFICGSKYTENKNKCVDGTSSDI